MVIFAEVTENECIIERLLRDPFAIPVLFRPTCPIWLRAQVSKQISPERILKKP